MTQTFTVPTVTRPQPASAEERQRTPATEAAPLRARREQTRDALLSLLDTPGTGGVTLARRNAERVDALLRELYANTVVQHPGPSLLLGAVGGYGRRLLGLESDLDLCFVTEADPAEVAPRIEALLYPLWDAGFNVGHQLVRVRDVASDARADLTLATELLDFRPLAGELALTGDLQRQLSETIFAEGEVERFIALLEAQAAQRHEQFGDSVYLLEPDVKNGTGGLRDLDFALWGARARLGTGDLGELAAGGVLTQMQKKATRRALDFLWTIRNHLHRSAGRKSDRLTFGEQEVVAQALGYAPATGPSLPPVLCTGITVEAFMSDYYRNARTIAQARDRILGQAKRRPEAARARPQPLFGGLVSCGGRIGLEQPERLFDDPPLALRLYAVAVEREMPLLSRTRDAIARATDDPSFCERLRACREASVLFVSLLCDCNEMTFAKRSILGELHDVGLLLAMIPEFAPVVGRVHHDLYHVYTVDVHSVAAVDRLRALTRGDVASRHPLATRLAAEVDDPRGLFLATLLHDIGKDIGGKGHAERGAVLAREILGRFGLPEDLIDDVCHLVRQHLTMYIVAMRRDLSDPEAIAEFARDVSGREGLRNLYLLTVADLSTTSTVAMTSWKADMLVGLYRATDAYLGGRVGGVSVRAQRAREHVRALWPDAQQGPALEQFLHSMPDRYFLANNPAEIAAHAALALAPSQGNIACGVVPSDQAGTIGLCVVTQPSTNLGLYVVAGDRPGLLAAIAAAISASGLTIRAAQINSRTLPDGAQQAVDLFWVRRDGSEEEHAAKVEQLERDLRAILGGELSPKTLVKPPERPSWSERPSPAVTTEVLFDHHGSTEHTIIEVLTKDRFGLLFLLAQTLHDLGLSISVAKVSTEGTRAIDVVYVTEASGRKLAQGARTEEVRAALLAALDGGREREARSG